MSTTPSWAQQACRLCRTRKKACDKLLPRCTYCAKRGVTCVYEQTSSNSGVLPPTHDDHLAAGALQAAQAVLATPPGPFALLMSPVTPEPSDFDAAMALTVRAHVTDSLRAAGLSPESAWETFFRDFWPYLSIVSPRFFEDEIKKPVAPRVESSLMLLAMCLVTRRSAQPVRFYAAFKTLVSAVQTFKHTSVMMMQVHLLIAAFEYSKDWLEAAAVTISICTRMGRLLGIDKAGKMVEHYALGDGMVVMESWNIWCGTALLETVISTDMARDRLHNDLLDSDTYNACKLDESTSHPIPYSVSDVNGYNHHEPFVRQLQAAWLLQKVVNTTRSQFSWDELYSIDGELNSLLRLCLHDEGRTTPVGSGSMGVSIAIILRARYALHEWILREVSTPSRNLTEATREEYKRRAKAAIESATRILTDTTASRTHHHHKLSSVHILPLCCRRNLEAAKGHLSIIGADEEVLARLTSLEHNF